MAITGTFGNKELSTRYRVEKTGAGKYRVTTLTRLVSTGYAFVQRKPNFIPYPESTASATVPVTLVYSGPKPGYIYAQLVRDDKQMWDMRVVIERTPYLTLFLVMDNRVMGKVRVDLRKA